MAVQQLGPAKDTDLRNEGVLKAWLEQHDLGEHYEKAQDWVEKEGAAMVSELEEEWAGLSKALGLSSEVAAAVKASFSQPNHEARSFDPGGEFQHKYRVMDMIGCGATSSVWRCKRLEGGGFFAVKVIDLTRQPAIAVRQELEVMARLGRHRNVIALHAAFETSLSTCLVMDLVDGDLREYINRRCGKGNGKGHAGRPGLSENRAKHVFREVVAALQHVHSHGIVHCDLKPENVAVSGDVRPEVKLLDFGCAQPVDSALRWTGTPNFNAPELFGHPVGDKYDKTGLDLWALGCTVFAMLEGRYLLPEAKDDKARAELAVRVMHPELKYSNRRERSAEARDLIKQLLEVAPSRRLSLASCLAHAWAQ